MQMEINHNSELNLILGDLAIRILTQTHSHIPFLYAGYELPFPKFTSARLCHDSATSVTPLC